MLLCMFCMCCSPVFCLLWCQRNMLFREIARLFSIVCALQFPSASLILVLRIFEGASLLASFGICSSFTPTGRLYYLLLKKRFFSCIFLKLTSLGRWHVFSAGNECDTKYLYICRCFFLLCPTPGMAKDSNHIPALFSFLRFKKCQALSVFL